MKHSTYWLQTWVPGERVATTWRRNMIADRPSCLRTPTIHSHKDPPLPSLYTQIPFWVDIVERRKICEGLDLKRKYSSGSWLRVVKINKQNSHLKWSQEAGRENSSAYSTHTIDPNRKRCTWHLWQEVILVYRLNRRKKRFLVGPKQLANGRLL